jgi:hypothetical protein
MTLIVEDGSIVADANSYISLADALLRAPVLGVTISAVTEEGESQLIQAAYALDRDYRSFYKGSKTDPDNQSMQWPRTGVTIDNIEQSENSIPQEVIDSQIFMAGYIASGVDLNPVDDGREIASEEVVGAVKQAYFKNGRTGATVELTGVEQTIQPVIAGSANSSYIEQWA